MCSAFCCISQKQADVNTGLLLLGALCHILLLAFDHAVSSGEQAADAAPRLWLSRACSIVMLLAYVAYLFFQLKTHRQLYESEEVRVHTPNDTHSVSTVAEWVRDGVLFG